MASSSRNVIATMASSSSNVIESLRVIQDKDEDPTNWFQMSNEEECRFEIFGKDKSSLAICFACCKPSKTDENSCPGCWSPSKNPEKDARLYYGRHTINYKRLFSLVESNDFDRSATQLYDLENKYTGLVYYDSKNDLFFLNSRECPNTRNTMYQVAARELQKNYTQRLNRIVLNLESVVKSQNKTQSRTNSNSRRESRPSSRFQRNTGIDDEDDPATRRIRPVSRSTRYRKET